MALLYPNVHSESEGDAHLVDAFQGAVKVGGQEVGGEVDAGEEPFWEGEAETRGEFPRVEATEGSGGGTGGDGCEGMAGCEGELYAGLIAPLGVEVEGERKGEVESKGGVVPFNCFIQFIGRGGVAVVDEIGVEWWVGFGVLSRGGVDVSVEAQADVHSVGWGGGEGYVQPYTCSEQGGGNPIGAEGCQGAHGGDEGVPSGRLGVLIAGRLGGGQGVQG